MRSSRSWRFITLLLVALTMGLSFAHTLEMPAKLEYDGPLYITLQKSLYRWWGPPFVGAFLEPGAVLATAVLTFQARRRRWTFALTLAAALLLLLAFPVVFFVFVEPANAVFRPAMPAAPPADWMRLRSQWEYGHAARFGLHLAAFAALLLSSLGQTEHAPAGRNGRTALA